MLSWVNSEHRPVNKLDYFLRSVQDGKYLHRAWLLSVFAILPPDQVDIKNADTSSGGSVGLVTDSKGQVSVLQDDESYAVISDHVGNTPLFGKDEKVSVKSGSLPMFDKDVNTTYGIFIMNALLLHYPYEGLAKYINGPMSPGMLNGIAYDILKEGKMPVDSHIRFENAASMITCLSQVGVPSASRKSVTPNKKAIVLRDKLVKENKDNMNDPAVVAGMQKVLGKEDDDYLKGDPSTGFYIGGKASKGRMRLNTMYGSETDFHDESKIHVMTPSLAEGWDVDNMPMLINTLRGGSYSRGTQTALGGESAKVTSRIFQNYKVEGEDCGTKLGIPITLTADNFENFIGRSLAGQVTPLQDSKLRGMIGKTVTIRSPAFCQAPGTTLCKSCMGKVVSESSVGLNAQAVIAASTFLGLFMGAMHSSGAVNTERYDYKSAMS